MGKGQTAGANEYLQKQIDEINTSLTDVAIPLLLTDWSDNGDGTFTQVVTINGLGEGAVPLITLSSVGDIATDDENYSYACISDVITSENTITFIASRKPSISFTVVAKGVVAAENSTVADITALVGRVSELEEANSKLNSEKVITGSITKYKDLENIEQAVLALHNDLSDKQSISADVSVAGNSDVVIGVRVNATRGRYLIMSRTNDSIHIFRIINDGYSKKVLVTTDDINMSANTNKITIKQTTVGKFTIRDQSWYMVRNGVCYLQLNFNLSDEIKASDEFFPLQFPKTIGGYYYMSQGSGQLRIGSDGKGRVHGVKGDYCINGSYPITV